ncbi:MAG TPA: hypothetical protein PLO78_00830 [Candidatus Omnitrophota bacterium]|nr:hypothetical protein [Candidatus Omnitrophota bacterium]
MKKLFLCLAFLGSSFIWMGPSVYAGMANGLKQIVLAPFEIPKAMLQGGLNPISMVGGVMTGTARTVTNIIGGVGEMAQGTAATASQAAKEAAPYAKYAPFFFL